MIARTTNKRSKLERETDLRLIVELLAKCKNHNEVREELNALRPYTLSQQQVNFDIAKAKRVYAYILYKDEERARLADQLVEIFSLACKEFERSKVTPSVKTVSTRLGDPKYLMIMIQALKARAKVLGFMRRPQEQIG